MPLRVQRAGNHWRPISASIYNYITLVHLLRHYLNSGMMSKPFPLVVKSRRLESARISIFFCESHVSVPMCGSKVAFGNSNKRGFTWGSSGKTSKPTAPSCASRQW